MSSRQPAKVMVHTLAHPRVFPHGVGQLHGRFGPRVRGHTCILDPRLARFPVLGAFGNVVSSHVQLNGKPLEQRGTDLASVPPLLRGIAGAPFGMLSTCAQVHGGHNPWVRGPMGRSFRPVQMKRAGVHDVPQRFSCRPGPFREFIEKQKAVVSLCPCTWHSLTPSPRPEQSAHAAGRVRREKGLGLSAV